MSKHPTIKQNNIPYEGGIDFQKTDGGEVAASIILPKNEKGEERVSIKVLPLFLWEALTLKAGKNTEKINGVSAVRFPKANWQTEKPKSINFYCDSGGQIFRLEIPRKELREKLEEYYPLLSQEKEGE